MLTVMRALALTLPLLALTAACATPPAPTTTTARVDGKDAYADYLSCLQQQGIPVPSTVPSIPPPDPSAPRPTGPQFPGGGPSKPPAVPDADWTKAKAACAHIIPQL